MCEHIRSWEPASWLGQVVKYQEMVLLVSNVASPGWEDSEGIARDSFLSRAQRDKASLASLIAIQIIKGLNVARRLCFGVGHTKESLNGLHLGRRWGGFSSQKRHDVVCPGGVCTKKIVCKGSFV